MREWVKARRGANGVTTVTVSLWDGGNLSARYTVKAYGRIKAAVTEARVGAHRMLEELREATRTDESEAA